MFKLRILSRLKSKNWLGKCEIIMGMCKYPNTLMNQPYNNRPQPKGESPNGVFLVRNNALAMCLDSMIHK